jgi:hypothetical protein
MQLAIPSLTETHCTYDRERVLRPDFPMFRAQCKACAISSLAAGPDFWRGGLDGGDAKPYRIQLARIFGDGWRAGHELVKAEHARIRLARATLQP